MVAATAGGDRIQSALTLVAGDIRALTDLERDWDQLDESVQVSLSLELAHSMAGYLVELDEQYPAGQMTPMLRERYCTLLCGLKDALPAIERSNRCRPRCLPAPARLSAVTDFRFKGQPHITPNEASPAWSITNCPRDSQ